MNLLDKINEDLNSALKSGDRAEVSTLRLLKNSLKNARINKGQDLTESDEISILHKEAKQRRESIDSFGQANRNDLIEKEEAELKIIEKYLPVPFTEQELNDLIAQVIADTGANTPNEMGKVMGALSPKIAGRADGGMVANLVRQKLAEL